MRSNEKSILFCFGNGGHKAQAFRLASLICKELKDYNVISLSDLKLKPYWSSEHFVSGELRKKNSHFDIFINFGPINILKSIKEISKCHKVKVVISTGPGISIVASILFKLAGARIIHIETWSRFNTKSLTGKLMYLVSDRFYVQNLEQKKLYRNSIYSGRL
ncbi:polysaccharide biosynthesis protein [Vibrio parahaemolyticus]|uniref:PssD/Cps14F family polysaccharide biosynthesis glycosyltransferase n=1 Tax=Vibrio parahaemolyticus TaxID=670 RepID=UPI0006A5F62E|nr:PssD/Cps14F family polysaccharide biosynthesis glycosyltransferase [Vibrio parahaemolyticus]KOE00639.1 polysaccharide biosynthesis protein [Vibrio parahaemolyticus]MBM4858132.1 polysaccharide biosynthesis protein [Vibrio parahaemolyticus]